MNATISIIEDDVTAALRGFLMSVLPAGTEVVRGQDNRVGEPIAPDFFVLTPLFRTRLSTNSRTYVDPGTNPGGVQITTAYAFHVQIDIHGPNASDNSAMIATLFHDDYAFDYFINSNSGVAPLYCDDPKQMAFINGENQYEDRWIITAVLQYNPVTTVPQDFADALHVNVVSVDATYPT